MYKQNDNVMIKYSIYFLQSSKYSLHNKHIIKRYNILFSKKYVCVEQSWEVPLHTIRSFNVSLISANTLFGGLHITYLISSSTKI